MPASTRSSNKDAKFEVYYSKKVPQQKFFPHRRKTVRRPDAEQDGRDKRQMVFLKEGLRRTNTIQDSDDEGGVSLEEDKEEPGVTIGEKEEDESRTVDSRGKKRSGDAMQECSEENDEPIPPTPKRRRKGVAPNERSSVPMATTDSDDEHHTHALESDNEDTKPTLRRQSTMTQIIDGRKPLPGTEFLDFKPVRRSPRASRGGKSAMATDRKQRTLTQMVPGLVPLGMMSDENLEEEAEESKAEEEASQAYNDEVARRFFEQGLLQTNEDDYAGGKSFQKHVSTAAVSPDSDEVVQKLSLGHGLRPPDEIIGHLRTPSKRIAFAAVPDEEYDDDDDEYQPTQYIDAPITTTRTPRRAASRRKLDISNTGSVQSTTRKPKQSRFSLLSTPEKRRVFEIPSSQSPESSLSTQVSPLKLHRTALKERNGNTSKATDTPSKRKQVTFQEPEKEPARPPLMEKFASTIPDSEEDDDDILEDSEQDNTAQSKSSETQIPVRGFDISTAGSPVGAKTQAMLHFIDRACADAQEKMTWTNREPSEEFGEVPIDFDVEFSQELGETCFANRDFHQEERPKTPLPECHTKYADVKEEGAGSVDMSDVPMPSSPPSHQTPQDGDLEDRGPLSTRALLRSSPIAGSQSTPPRDHPRIHDSIPSTPMFIGGDESSDEEEEPALTPAHATSNRRPLSATAGSNPLDNRNIDHAVQVPRSPSLQAETQDSYSSKAEQQLQHEHQSYSQFHPTGLPPSSMHVAHDTGYSYQATPFPPRPPTQAIHYSDHISQATTIDPTQPTPKTTPRKPNTQHARSATVTPSKPMSSPCFISPARPPSLFIPSSFPSPARVVMEGWSSPLLPRSRGGKADTQYAEASYDDFSIPAPPPLALDDEDGEL